MTKPDDAIPNDIKLKVREYEEKTKHASRNKYMPTEAEYEDAEEHRELANALNREMSRLIREGQIEGPQIGMVGFGGLLDPPRWADRTREARDDLA